MPFILCSDIHLSHKPPLARSAEPDWYKAMERQLFQLREFCWQYEAHLLIAGDIFNIPNPPPELINWTIYQFQRLTRDFNTWTIPGQHDLPYHNYNDLHKSAYTTLVAAGVIRDLPPEVNTSAMKISGWDIYAFPWGKKIEAPLISDRRKLALCHRYVWTQGSSYEGAIADAHVSRTRKLVECYDVAVFGDNHKGFIVDGGKDPHVPSIVNCGTFFRRTIDERTYKPFVTLLTDDGKLRILHLDTSEDKWMDVEEIAKHPEFVRQFSKLMEELTNSSDRAIEFDEVLSQVLEERSVSNSIRQILLRAMGK